MRYMIIVKSTRASEAGVMPTEPVLARMAAYHEALAKAGVLVDASGLQSSSRGWRVEYQGTTRSVVDGPFPETQELIAGFTIIKVKSEKEAHEWTLKFPNPSLDGSECFIEVRRMFDLEDFEPSEAVRRFRAIPGNGRPAGGA